jgi:citrate lyase subunit beta/citryl-CoA lyase
MEHGAAMRSVLFVPGNSMRMIVKAAGLPADVIVFDLEDAVPLSEKATARIMVRDAIAAAGRAGSAVYVRVNALGTGLADDDLAFSVVPGLAGIMLSKTQTADDVTALAGSIAGIEKERGMAPGVRVLPLIETAQGVLNAAAIAPAHERVAALAFGAGDYCRDMGREASSLSPEQTELLFARSAIANAAVAAGVRAIDTVFFGLLTDREAFARELDLATRLGFHGKLLIHPTQIEPTNRAFSPAPAEVERSRRLIEAFEAARSRGAGCISFEGRMVDAMNCARAREVVAAAEAAAAGDRRRQTMSPVSLTEFFPAAGT